MQPRPQLTLFPLTCAHCEESILPGQPYAQTASVDVVDAGIAVSSVRSFHTEKGCYRAAKLERWAAESGRIPRAHEAGGALPAAA